MRANETQSISQVADQQPSLSQAKTLAAGYEYWRAQLPDDEFKKLHDKLLTMKKAEVMKLLPLGVDLLSKEVQEGMAEITLTEEELLPGIKRLVQAEEGRLANIEYAKKVYGEEKPFVPAEYDLATMKEYLCWWYQSNLPKGREMIMTPEYRHLYTQICKYYAGDESCEWDLDKDLLFMGRVGDGKSMLMRCFQFNQRMSYRMVPASDIAELYKTHGLEVLKTYRQYGKQSRNRFGQIEHTWCIDDIGSESIYRHFGDHLNVVEYLITKTYEDGVRVHYTTNLNNEEILNTYGERATSRLRERCNQVVLPNVDLRK